jgi:mono/diheme cytochrome c family protein
VRAAILVLLLGCQRMLDQGHERTALAPPPDAVAIAPAEPPMRPIGRAAMLDGRAVFDRTCAVCHGARADGVSLVAEHMQFRRPPSLLNPFDPDDDEIDRAIRFGYGLMRPYDLDAEQRRDVIAYLVALRFSLAAPIDRLPPQLRARFQ